MKNLKDVMRLVCGLLPKDDPRIMQVAKQLVVAAEAKFVLRALENGGVDNWEWHGESLRQANYFELEENEKFTAEQFLQDCTGGAE